MAITWSSSGSTDWSVDANWSGGVAPTSSDDVIFNATSVIACSLSAASVCKSLTTTSAYTGAFSTNGKSLTISGSCSFDNTSALTINSTITLNADGDFHIGTNITSFTGGGTIDLQGTGNFDVDENISGSPIGKLKCAYNGKTTTNTGDLTYDMCIRQLEVCDGTFTVSAQLLISNNNGLPLIVHEDHIINGTKGIVVYTSANSTLPALNFTFTEPTIGLIYYNTGTGDKTLDFTGDIISTGKMNIQNQANSGTFTVNTNDYTITVAGGNPSLGFSNNFNGTTIFNFGNSTINMTGGTGIIFHRLAGGETINLQTSTWNLANGAGWYVSDDSVQDPGTSVINFVNGQVYNAVWYDANVTGYFTMTGPVSAHNLIIYNSNNNGIFTQGGKALTISGNLSIRMYENTINGPITMTGDGTLTIIPTTQYTGTTTMSSCVLTLQGNTTITISLISAAVATFSRIIFSAGKTYTWTSTDKIAVTNFTAGDWSGTSGNRMKWISSSPTNAYQINAPANVIMEYVDITDCNNVGNNINVMTDYNKGLNNTGFTWASLATLLTIPQIRRNFIQSIFRKRIIGGI